MATDKVVDRINKLNQELSEALIAIEAKYKPEPAIIRVNVPAKVGENPIIRWQRIAKKALESVKSSRDESMERMCDDLGRQGFARVEVGFGPQASEDKPDGVVKAATKSEPLPLRALASWPCGGGSWLRR